MERWQRLCGWGLGLTALMIAPTAPAQPGPIEQQVSTEHAAYALLPPELIAAPVVRQVEVSTDGRYILIEQTRVLTTPESFQQAAVSHEPPPGDTVLLVWDRRSHTRRELWRAPWTAATVEQIAWLPHTDVALALLQQTGEASTRFGLLRITAASGQAQPVALTVLPDLERLELSVSPQRPEAVVTDIRHRPVAPEDAAPAGPKAERSFSFLGPSGAPGPRILLPAGSAPGPIQWDEAADPVVSLQIGSGAGRSWYRLDRAAPQLQALERPPVLYSAPAVEGQPLRLRLAETAVNERETTRKLDVLWLESATKSPQPRALVCGDSTGGQLLAGDEAVIYRSQGALWALPLVKLSQEQRAALAAQAGRIAAIRQAKQIGLALARYARDHDGALPAGDALADELQPYLDGDVLPEEFTYTFAGGPLAPGDRPAEQVIGFLSEPGGRAALFADGHVVWSQ